MNNQEQIWKVGKWVGILLGLFLVVISIKELKSIAYVGKDTTVVSSISVNGKGETISIPDIATFSFSVTENAKTVKEAQDKATTRTSTAIDAVKKGGVDQKDIKTLAYNITPHYDYQQIYCITTPCPQGKNVLSGYDVSQTIQVKVRDLSKAGDIFGSIGDVGVQNVDSLAFSIDNIDEVRATARANAIANAQVKAKKIASDLGVTLVRITSFSDDSSNISYGYAPMAMDMAMTKSAGAPQIPAGEQKITSNVVITYEIR